MKKKRQGVLSGGNTRHPDRLQLCGLEADTASETARCLSRILLNTRGPKQCKRKLLTSVVTSQLLYATPAWAEAVRVKRYVMGVEGTYRICALRVACAFRTVSDDAALVIAGQVPIGELVQKAQEARLLREPGNSSARREDKSSARRRSIARWQSSWIDRKHGEVDFYLTQELSGHGCFRSYL
ncbi:uncharacterized protein [Drosophila kikkawai]|uniref:Uncharacterized protein n=1 Tax=Drosophila kikkawai TaxID=30033 RepID=A0ABM4GHW2_DROKI